MGFHNHCLTQCRKSSGIPDGMPMLAEDHMLLRHMMGGQDGQGGVLTASTNQGSMVVHSSYHCMGQWHGWQLSCPMGEAACPMMDIGNEATGLGFAPCFVAGQVLSLPCSVAGWVSSPHVTAGWKALPCSSAG